MDLGNGEGQRRADGWGEGLIDWLETRRATWLRGPGCNQFQYQGAKKATTTETTRSVRVSFLSHLLQVLALGSPRRTRHGMQVGAADQGCGSPPRPPPNCPGRSALQLRLAFAERTLWEGLGEATE